MRTTTNEDRSMKRMETILREHSQAYGALCHDGGDGCCEKCGVGLDECPKCKGIGYHRPECPEMEGVL